MYRKPQARDNMLIVVRMQSDAVLELDAEELLDPRARREKNTLIGGAH